MAQSSQSYETSIKVQNKDTDNSNKLLVLVLLASPLLLLLAFTVYYLLTLGEIWQSLTSALALFVAFLLTHQIIISSIKIIQIFLSLMTTRRNVISRRFNSRFALVDSPKTQPVSILLWAHNQGNGLDETIKSLLALNYPDFEIIIINDGSNDSTIEVLETEFGLQPLNRVFRRSLQTSPITAIYTSPKYPIITVVEKPYTGRADSLNIGINLAKAPLICIVEPNHLLTRDALLLLAKPFIEQPNTTIMTAGLGEARVNIEEISLTENLNIVEKKYLFHSSFILRDSFCLVSASSNAVRLLRKTELIEIGGFSSNEISDLTISLKLQKLLGSKNRNYRLVYIPEILCWENNIFGNPNANLLHRNWQKTVLTSTTNNVNLLLQKPTKKLFWAYLLLIFETISPILILLSIILSPIAYLLGAISIELLILYFISFITFSFLESLLGIIADEFSLRYQHSLAEVVNLVLSSLVESLGYKQLMNFWRTVGAISTLIT